MKRPASFFIYASCLFIFHLFLFSLSRPRPYFPRPKSPFSFPFTNNLHFLIFNNQNRTPYQSPVVFFDLPHNPAKIFNIEFIFLTNIQNPSAQKSFIRLAPDVFPVTAAMDVLIKRDILGKHLVYFPAHAKRMEN